MLTLLPFHVALAADYCVKNLPLPQVTKAALLGKDSKATFDNNAVLSPEYIYAPQDSNHLMIAASVQVPTDREGYVQNVGHVLWGINPRTKSFSGPYAFRYTFDEGDIAIDPKNGMATIMGYRSSNDGIGIHAFGSKRTHQEKLFYYDFEHAPSALPDHISDELKWPSHIAWSDILNGILVTSEAEKEPALVHFRVNLLINRTVLPLKIDSAEYVKTLTADNLAAILSRGALHLVDPQGNVLLSQPLNSGDDFNGWDGIEELGNHWLYVKGAQYHHALHITNQNGKWAVDQLVRIHEKVGLGEMVMRSILGMDKEQKHRDGLSDVIYASPGTYSEMLKQLIFPEERSVLLNGKLEAIEGEADLDWDVGDIPYLGITLFWGGNALYSYDGKVSKKLNGDFIERGRLSVLPNQKRSFYATKDGQAYELVAENGAISAKKIGLPQGEMFTRFFESQISDAVIIFDRHGIYSLQNGQLNKIWEPNTLIDITGNMTPVYSSELQAILFYTPGKNAEMGSLNLLSPCANN